MKLSQLWPWRARSLEEEMRLREPVDSTLVQNTMLMEFLRERRSERRWGQFKRALFTLVIVGGFAMSVYGTLRFSNAIPPSPGGEYKVGTVAIRGVIGDGQGAAEAVIPAIRRAFEDERTEVIVLRIDSPGGSPAEAERIYAEVERLKEKHKKKVEAVIDNLGASAAYLIAIHTERITASKYSLVGSVGAIMHTWNAADLAQKIGVQQLGYASGVLKDMGNPTRPPTELEREKAKALVTGIADSFAKEVLLQRAGKLKLDTPALTTGEAWSGADAQGFGLVDDLGTLEAVLARYQSPKSRHFGPFPRTLFSSTSTEWMHSVGAALMDGALSSLQASARGSPWHTE